MITKEQIRKIRRGVASLERPVLSMYLEMDPSNPHEAWVRARGTMGSLGVPDELAKSVMAALNVPQNRAPSLAVFADAKTVDVIGLPFELPVIDPRTGHVDARFGDPYVSPLVLALDQHERFAVVLIGRDRCRTFEVYLGEIEEMFASIRQPSPGELNEFQQRQSFPSYIPARDNAAKDRLDRRVFEWVVRFFGTLADDLEDAMMCRGIGSLILLGPDRDLPLFESALSRPLLDRVVAMEQGLDMEAPASQVLERVWRLIERVEAERTKRVIDDAENEGARGTEKCLVELQQGRVHTVVAPWNLEDEVFETEEGYVTVSEDDAAQARDGARKVPLKVVLPDLVSAYGARLTFARGENERRLVSDLGGMSGLLRW